MNTLTIELINDEYHFNGFIESEELMIDFYSPTVEDGMEQLSEYDFDIILED